MSFEENKNGNSSDVTSRQVIKSRPEANESSSINNNQRCKCFRKFHPQLVSTVQLRPPRSKLKNFCQQRNCDKFLAPHFLFRANGWCSGRMYPLMILFIVCQSWREAKFCKLADFAGTELTLLSHLRLNINYYVSLHLHKIIEYLCITSGCRRGECDERQ